MFDKWLVGDWLALSGIIVTVVGLWIALIAIHRGNKNSSAASLIALNECIRQAWERFFRAEETDKQYQFAELANALEIACALWVKGEFAGVSQKLLTEYLDAVMRLLDGNHDARERLEGLIVEHDTFEYLKQYIGKRRRHIFRDERHTLQCLIRFIQK